MAGGALDHQTVLITMKKGEECQNPGLVENEKFLPIFH
jgi:hypothetical protein